MTTTLSRQDLLHCFEFKPAEIKKVCEPGPLVSDSTASWRISTALPKPSLRIFLPPSRLSPSRLK